MTIVKRLFLSLSSFAPQIVILLLALIYIIYISLSFQVGTVKSASDELVFFAQRFITMDVGENQNDIEKLRVVYTDDFDEFHRIVDESVLNHEIEPNRVYVHLKEFYNLFKVSHFMIYCKLISEGKEYFVVMDLHPDFLDQTMNDALKKSLSPSILLFSLLILSLFVYQTIKHQLFIKNLQTLSGWFDNLAEQEDAPNLPEIKEEKLKLLAQTAQNSVVLFRNVANKEHMINLYTSHEIKNHLSVIMANMQLLDQFMSTMSHRERRVLSRMELEINDMKAHVEGLMLIEKDISDSDIESVDVREVLRKSLGASDFLAIQNNVSIKDHLEPLVVETHASLLEVIFNNLVQNALEYSRDGYIHLSTEGQEIVIENGSVSQKPPTSKGFGIGLHVVEELSQKLGLEYNYMETTFGRKVTLKF